MSLVRACLAQMDCITLAPALKAALASRAIPRVTGTVMLFRVGQHPFSAQVMTALSLMECFSICSGFVRNRYEDHATCISSFLASTRYRRVRPGRSDRSRDRASRKKIARGIRP